MLDTFNTNASPTSVTTHLSTFDHIEELARITECLLQGTYDIDQYDSLRHAHTILKLQNASDSALEKNAQALDLATVKTMGDGNCLQYAINESHRQWYSKPESTSQTMITYASSLRRSQEPTYSKKEPTYPRAQ